MIHRYGASRLIVKDMKRGRGYERKIINHRANTINQG
jgi:hypothetical protein